MREPEMLLQLHIWVEYKISFSSLICDFKACIIINVTFLGKYVPSFLSTEKLFCFHSEKNDQDIFRRPSFLVFLTATEKVGWSFDTTWLENSYLKSAEYTRQ